MDCRRVGVIVKHSWRDARNCVRARTRVRSARRDKAKREVTSAARTPHCFIYNRFSTVNSRGHTCSHPTSPFAPAFASLPPLCFIFIRRGVFASSVVELTRVTNKQFIRHRDRQISHDFPRLLPLSSLSAIFACYLTRYSLFLRISRM